MTLAMQQELTSDAMLGLLILLLGFGVLCFLVLAVAYAADGVKGVLKVLWFPWKIGGKHILAPALLWSGRTTASGIKELATGERTPRVSDPTNAELEQRRTVNPAHHRDQLENGLHDTVGGQVEAVHKVIVAMAGAGKNQADLNYELQHQLKYSDEHLILTDPKANAPLTKIVQAYARPGVDRIFVYSFHPKDHHSSSLRLFCDPSELSDLAFMLTDEPNAKDSHWNEKAAEAIAAVAQALTETKRQAESAAAQFAGEENGTSHEITATLNEVRDIIADRRKLEELRDISPLVDNVADVEKEWGFIRSTASRRLTALSDPIVRRVFAGGADTPQPDFTRSDGRDIVIIRPFPRSAKRLSRYVFAGLDTTYRAAADGGDAGGPGTKVLVDEAASYMKLEQLDEYLDLGRESKVQLTYVLQGTKQLAAKLGKERAEAIIGSTEIKVVGATDDLDTADMISKLSKPQTVHYRKAAQADELRGQWDTHQRRLIEPYEINSQGRGEFTLLQSGRAWKVTVPQSAYHYTQAAPPRTDHPLWGWVDPSTYPVPAILAPTEEDEEDGEDPEDSEESRAGDRSGRSSHDDIPDDDPPEEGDDDDDWID